MASNSGYSFQLLNAVIEVNDLQPRRAVQRLKAELGTLRGKRVALLGMTIKPGTDDMREAPSTVPAARLLAEGAALTCWDPMARPADAAPWNQAERRPTVLDALTGADAAVVVTEWRDLLDADWTAARDLMRGRVVFDGRNLLDPAALAGLGYTCLSVGRATARP
ncbi:UDP binding domain-containing protein [Streptomyces cyanogenus]|uniref:UDP-glucose 6-dehydrogenase YwqF n=1 Tax=Streptomyces cyanogenus TaxID=80860 RepID=A0ABX7TPW7_STRCY|nr:UDP binding domain-containing protein [Streptomyces cyanogenus]QTD98436.1 UDP-glucose 6-dehydrogenase YwqF [Streptomyces cyanogenus]